MESTNIKAIQAATLMREWARGTRYRDTLEGGGAFEADALANYEPFIHIFSIGEAPMMAWIGWPCNDANSQAEVEYNSEGEWYFVWCAACNPSFRGLAYRFIEEFITLAWPKTWGVIAWRGPRKIRFLKKSVAHHNGPEGPIK